MFLGVNKKKEAFYHLLYWYMSGFFIATNFFLTTESLGTNVVIIKRCLCISFKFAANKEILHVLTGTSIEAPNQGMRSTAS